MSKKLILGCGLMAVFLTTLFVTTQAFAANLEVPITSDSAKVEGTAGSEIAANKEDTGKEPAKTEEAKTPNTEQNSQTASSNNNTSTSSSTNNQTIADGTYEIQSSIGKMVDVSGGSMSDGAIVWTYEENETNAQRWNVTWDNGGYYKISNEGSNLYLSYNSSTAQNDAPVIQDSWKNASNQKWLIIQCGSGYKIVSATNQAFVIDVAGGIYANGQKIQLYQANGTAAQIFYFLNVAGIKAEESTIASGIYTINTKQDGSLVLDVSGGTWDNGGNVQIYANNNSLAQKWYVAKQSDGFYVISNLGSGKALDVSGGMHSSGTNVQQYDRNDSNAQKWTFKLNEDGSYSIINAISGMLLDVNGGSFTSGTNVWAYINNGSIAQKWTFAIADALANGVYSLVLNTGLVMDVPGGSAEAGVQPQTYSSNSTAAQKWKVAKSDSGYTIQSLTSGKYLTNDGSGNLTLQEKNNATSQTWIIGFNLSGMLLISASNTSVFIYSMTTNETALFLIGTTNTGNLKELRFRNVQIIENGNYIVQNVNGNVLDVDSGFFNSGTNVQSFASNDSGAQKWRIEHRGGDVYTLINLRSEKALDLSNGITRNGQNVHQFDYNGTGAQLWYFELDENCNIILRAVNDRNFVLDIAGGSSANGANIQVYQFNDSGAQKWKFISTGGYSITGDGELDNIVRACWARIGEGGDRLWNAFNFVKNFGYRNGSTWPGGDWCNSFAKEMYYNGSGNCYRFAALFTVLGRSIGYSMNAISGYHNYGGVTYAHGWTEVYCGGQTYVCDPDGAHEFPGRNWYWVTYANAPLAYRK